MKNKHLPQSGRGYQDPFQSPRSNPKHAYHQVNGETQQALNVQILEVQTRKRS
ncbi:YpzG family protein [Evansella tamaricis]|uniref:YpzG family protein n=1 Tax=Evansella tamaricis TaxID=2069301 RepID=A0ABS6JE36_9BACI|nr:YpzG family protein [Evansella tamaricis]MBU9711836.1 YpzG family protein [Evansella tamaricis]